MRYYPFGSGSIPAIVLTSSLSSYATETLAADRVVSASRAIIGASGSAGPTGPCFYVSGSSGSQGPSGSQGATGTVDGPY